MFTGTDETRGLEEWNVNTIAHLEPEKPDEPFCPVGVGGARELAEWTNSRRQPPDFFFSPLKRILCCYTVIITNSTNKMDPLAKYQAPFPLASEEGIPPYHKEVRWPFHRSSSCSSAPLTSADEQKTKKKTSTMMTKIKNIHRKFLTTKQNYRKKKAKIHKLNLGKKTKTNCSQPTVNQHHLSFKFFLPCISNPHFIKKERKNRQELHQEYIKSDSSSSNKGQRETLGNYLMSFSFHKIMGGRERWWVGGRPPFHSSCVHSWGTCDVSVS